MKILEELNEGLTYDMEIGEVIDVDLTPISSKVWSKWERLSSKQGLLVQQIEYESFNHKGKTYWHIELIGECIDCVMEEIDVPKHLVVYARYQWSPHNGRLRYVGGKYGVPKLRGNRTIA